ncbi:MAG: hypothetical protein IT236_17340 [Bacteroidia bacterium]|nr:hypothetical protein [Bacteroidia bacterium]
MKVLTLFFLLLFLNSFGQIQTVKVKKPSHIQVCGLDTGIVSVDTVLKYPMLKITPANSEHIIKGYSARLNDDIHMSWWDCKGEKFCPDLIEEIINTNRNKMTILRVYDIIVIDKNKDTVKVNTIGLLLK